MITGTKKIVMILSSVFTVVIALSLSYAFFYYGKQGSEISLQSGSIFLDFNEDANYLTIHDAYPKSNNLGKIDTNYYDFTVSGSRGENDFIYYEVQIEQLENNTLDEDYVKVYLTDQNDNGYWQPTNLKTLEMSDYNQNRVVYTNFITNLNEVHTYRLRLWVDERYNKNVQETFNFRVVLFAINGEAPPKLYNVVSNDLTSHLLSSDGEDDYDGRIVSGAKNDNNLRNYVWYSGELWRIVSLNNNGTMKLVTNDVMKSTAYNSNGQTDFNNSDIKTWLNTNFLDTLYNYEGIIDTNSMWNATLSSSSGTKPGDTSMVKSPVGLLTAYEYTQSYSQAGNQTNGFLNIGSNWWTLTPRVSETSMWNVSDTGAILSSAPDVIIGVRPTINLKSTVTITSGDGTLANPYRIAGDAADGAQIATIGNCANITYDGEEHTLISGGSYVSYTNNTRTNAGSQEIVVTSNGNYTFSDGTKTKTINCSIKKRPVTYETESVSKPWDGTALTAPNATMVRGTLISGHTATFNISGSQTSVGSSTNTLNSVTIKNASNQDVSSNYNITKKNGTLTITQSCQWQAGSPSYMQSCTPTTIPTNPSAGDTYITCSSIYGSWRYSYGTGRCNNNTPIPGRTSGYEYSSQSSASTACQSTRDSESYGTCMSNGGVSSYGYCSTSQNMYYEKITYTWVC